MSNISFKELKFDEKGTNEVCTAFHSLELEITCLLHDVSFNVIRSRPDQHLRLYLGTIE